MKITEEEWKAFNEGKPISYIRSIDPRKGKQMNDNLSTSVVDPFMDPNLTDAELAKLLAAKPEPVDGEIVGTLGYVTFDEGEKTNTETEEGSDGLAFNIH